MFGVCKNESLIKENSSRVNELEAELKQAREKNASLIKKNSSRVNELEAQLKQARQENASLTKQLREQQPEIYGTPNHSPSSTGCVVTITNSLVALKRESSNSSPEIIRVPRGKYDVLAYANSETWYQIKIGERVGWIKNNTWTIGSKNNICP